MNKKTRSIDKARWPDRLTLSETKSASSALVKQEGSREAAAEKAEVSVTTLRRWIIGEDRAPKALKGLLRKRQTTRRAKS